jgi:hypothetical protein
LASNASLIKRIEALEQLLHTKGYQRPLSPLETARLLAHISAGDPDFAAQVDALGLDITGEIARFEAKQAQAPSTIKKASKKIKHTSHKKPPASKRNKNASAKAAKPKATAAEIAKTLQRYLPR